MSEQPREPPASPEDLEALLLRQEQLELQEQSLRELPWWPREWASSLGFPLLIALASFILLSVVLALTPLLLGIWAIAALYDNGKRGLLAARGMLLKSLSQGQQRELQKKLAVRLGLEQEGDGWRGERAGFSLHLSFEWQLDQPLIQMIVERILAEPWRDPLRAHILLTNPCLRTFHGVSRLDEDPDFSSSWLLHEDALRVYREKRGPASPVELPGWALLATPQGFHFQKADELHEELREFAEIEEILELLGDLPSRDPQVAQVLYALCSLESLMHFEDDKDEYAGLLLPSLHPALEALAGQYAELQVTWEALTIELWEEGRREQLLWDQTEILLHWLLEGPRPRKPRAKAFCVNDPRAGIRWLGALATSQEAEAWSIWRELLDEESPEIGRIHLCAMGEMVACGAISEGCYLGMLLALWRAVCLTMLRRQEPRFLELPVAHEALRQMGQWISQKPIVEEALSQILKGPDVARSPYLSRDPSYQSHLRLEALKLLEHNGTRRSIAEVEGYMASLGLIARGRSELKNQARRTLRSLRALNDDAQGGGLSLLQSQAHKSGELTVLNEAGQLGLHEKDQP